MKVAKRFRWEAAHRLPWHEAECKYVHGHSYRMMVELEGEPTEETPGARNMLIDFKHVKSMVMPVVDAMDHATLISETDEELLEAMEMLESKTYILPFDSTAENLATHILDTIRNEGRSILQKHGIEKIKVEVWETETCYAEASGEIPQTE